MTASSGTATAEFAACFAVYVERVQELGPNRAHLATLRRCWTPMMSDCRIWDRCSFVSLLLDLGSAAGNCLAVSARALRSPKCGLAATWK